jgi:ankyrin repeat protein
MTDKIPETKAARDRDLFFAALQGDTARMELLLKAGADPNTRQASEDYAPAVPALSAATEAGRLEPVALLVRHGAKVDEGTPEGRTPLMTAVRDGNVALAAFLINAGAKTTLRYGPETLTDMAEKCKHPGPMTHLLLEKLGKPKLTDVFLAAARDARPHVLEAALNLGADVNACDPSGNTALILVAQNTTRPLDAEKALRLLLQKDADIDAENDMRETALSAAMMRRPVPAETVRLLVDAGADITRDTLAGITVYEAAQLAGNEQILPCFEVARKQNILREVKKFYEGTGNQITVKRPLKPRKPPQ